MMNLRAWKDDPARVALLAVYAEADQLLRGFSCPSSTDCCHFGRTGREPYLTAVEQAELRWAVGAQGGWRPGGGSRAQSAAEKRRLTQITDDRRCAFLGPDDRCRVYASRPLGCRTFFCERAEGPGKQPRSALQALARKLAEVSAKWASGDPYPRTITRVVADWG